MRLMILSSVFLPPYFRALFIRSELEETVQEMVERQPSVLFRAVFKNYNTSVNSPQTEIQA